MKAHIITLIAMSMTLSAYGLETDNYLMWNRELKDSSQKINTFLASEINTALKIVNEKEKPQDCETVTNEIASRFMSYFVDENPFENYLKRTLDYGEIYPMSGDYVNASIYRDPYRFYVPAFGLSPNVSVNNIYFGTDKLTHFSSTGRRYFNHYLKELKSGLTDLESRKSAVLFGIKNETSILGYWSSGVYSYGDIEANYQGLLFYQKMCFNKKDTFLEQDQDGKWKLIERPDIRKYASPLWDETYNLSYRLPVNWVKVSKVIKENYCPMVYDNLVMARMDYYRSFKHQSFSYDYIKELQKNGFKDAPIPEATQSIEELCKI